jgi:hypothetical protein
MIAGAFIGLNRGARGHAAEFRTTTLVGLAASMAMIRAKDAGILRGHGSDAAAARHPGNGGAGAPHRRRPATGAASRHQQSRHGSRCRNSGRLGAANRASLSIPAPWLQQAFCDGSTTDPDCRHDANQAVDHRIQCGRHLIPVRRGYYHDVVAATHTLAFSEFFPGQFDRCHFLTDQRQHSRSLASSSKERNSSHATAPVAARAIIEQRGSCLRYQLLAARRSKTSRSCRRSCAARNDRH